tara:strand:+ start:2060 stop:2788 length:729 start_codon:yes stop_codon:yes gene_type:complete
MIPDNVSEAGIRLVKKFEGLHKMGDDGLIRSYRCPAGKWTIGYGATRGVRSGMRITEGEAEERLLADLNEHAEALHRYVEVPLSQNQYDALTSFVFNVGAANFKSSTLLKRLNSGQYHDIPNQLMRWNKARVDGKLTPLRGLTRRRAAEAALFSMDAKLAGDGGDKMPQKVEEASPKALTKSKTMAGAGLAGAATALSEITPQIEALVPYSESMKSIFLLCAIGGIALVAYSRWKDSKEGTR